MEGAHPEAIVQAGLVHHRRSGVVESMSRLEEQNESVSTLAIEVYPLLPGQQVRIEAIQTLRQLRVEIEVNLMMAGL